jgi:Holliday junction resolvase RusA-like endonuclease
MMISFIVPGNPQGKARARIFFNAKINKTCAMTPEKTVNYENLIKLCCRGTQIEGPLEMIIEAYYPIPKSASKKDHLAMLEGRIRPTKKPDADNVVKVIADALNGIAYKDDTQIVDLRIRKWYADVTRVEVQINRVEAKTL